MVGWCYCFLLFKVKQRVQLWCNWFCCCCCCSKPAQTEIHLQIDTNMVYTNPNDWIIILPEREQTYFYPQCFLLYLCRDRNDVIQASFNGVFIFGLIFEIQKFVFVVAEIKFKKMLSNGKEICKQISKLTNVICMFRGGSYLGYLLIWWCDVDFRCV